MVIAVHYLGGNDGFLSQSFHLSFNHAAARIIESICVICVNLFVMITGYFGVGKKELNIRRITDLILLVAFWNTVFYFGNCLTAHAAITLRGIIQALFPYLFGAFWYVRVYLILTLLAPFINITLVSAAKKCCTSLLVISLVLFSFLPSFFPAFENANGYDIIHFVLMYVIGGYLKLHLQKKPPVWLCFISWLGFSAATTLFSVYGDGLDYWGYDFITVIFSCIAFFLMVSQIHFTSAAVNFIGSLTFGIYILEGVLPAGIKYWGIRSDYFSSKFFLLHFAACTCSIFVGAAVLELLRKELFRFTVDKMLDKIAWINRKIDFTGKNQDAVKKSDPMIY